MSDSNSGKQGALPVTGETVTTWRPKILVLEGLAGTGECVMDAGGNFIDSFPTSVAATCDKIDADGWHGLVLTGGGDVDPRAYGQRPRKETYGVNENRDLVEMYALEVARERKVPVLGICRGAQIICVEAGGTMKQHVEGHRGTTHPVLTRDKTIMRAYAGLKPVVTSLHHQRVERVPRGYVVSSRANDGTIESIESQNGRVLGVQFHPEMDFLEEYAQGIFRWLVEEASVRQGMEAPPERPMSAFREGQGWYSTKTSTTAKKYNVPSYKQGVVGGRSSASKARTPSPVVTARTPAPVVTAWICSKCAIRFDKEKDRDDHELVLHGHVRGTTDAVAPERDEVTTSLINDLRLLTGSTPAV